MDRSLHRRTHADILDCSTNLCNASIHTSREHDSVAGFVASRNYLDLDSKDRCLEHYP